jgi:hypothetical protein
VTSERFWILVLAAVSFLAGIAGGILIAVRRLPVDATGPFADYQRRLVTEYGLGEEEEDRLAQILLAYHDDLEGLKARHVRELEPEYLAAGDACYERIVKYVVPEGRLDEFTLAARSETLPDPAPQ